MEDKPHIGKSGYEPGHIGYPFDCSLDDCTFVFHSLDRRDPLPGRIEIVPPAGKVAHSQIWRRIMAAEKALQGVSDNAIEAGAIKEALEFVRNFQRLAKSGSIASTYGENVEIMSREAVAIIEKLGAS